MIDPSALVDRLLAKNPALGNNPQARAYIDLLKSGDAAKGEEVANNLLQTYGIDRNEALAQARRFFGAR